MSGAYRYDELGFGPIQLDGGVEMTDSVYGQAIVYAKVDDLHAEIALALSQTRFPIKGKAIRFLRQTLGITQAQLGLNLGYNDGQMVALWEKDAREIPWPVDQQVRLMVRSKFDPRTSVAKAMRDLQQPPPSELRFRFKHGTWKWM